MIVTKKWIQEKYDLFNSKYWNGELPPIEFKTNMGKKAWGYASYEYIINENRTRIESIRPISITMSNYFDSPEEVKMATLLHEMIHIADYHFNPEHFINASRTNKNRKYDAHGPVFFMKEANRLKAYGWDINKTVTKEEVDISKYSDSTMKKLERIASKGYAVLIADDANGKQGGKWVLMCDLNNVEKFTNNFLNYSKKWFQANFINPEWFECYTTEFATLKKSTTKTTFRFVKDDVIEKALNSGKMKSLGKIGNEEINDDKMNNTKVYNLISDKDYILDYVFRTVWDNRKNMIGNMISNKKTIKTLFKTLTDKIPIYLTVNKEDAGLSNDAFVIYLNEMYVSKYLETKDANDFQIIKDEITKQILKPKIV